MVNVYVNKIQFHHNCHIIHLYACYVYVCSTISGFLSLTKLQKCQTSYELYRTEYFIVIVIS